MTDADQEAENCNSIGPTKHVRVLGDINHQNNHAANQHLYFSNAVEWNKVIRIHIHVNPCTHFSEVLFFPIK